MTPPSHTPYWEGKLVRLRSVEPDDWQNFQFFNQDSIYDRWTYFLDFPQSLETIKSWTASMAAGSGNSLEFRWMIETLNGEFVGTINSHTINPRAGTFQYGIATLRHTWRNGYAREAALTVMRHYFHELRYQKANVHIYSINPGSVAFHEALGFQHEGRIRRMGFTDGEYYDHIMMGMTVEEFNQKWAGKF